MEATKRAREAGGSAISRSIVEVTSAVDCCDMRIDSAEVIQPLKHYPPKGRASYLHAKQSFKEIVASLSFVDCPSFVTS